MADLSLVTDNYLPTASETFSDNLSGSITAGATTVPVNSAAEYADGQTVVLTVEPGTSNEATFVGKKDTGVNQFIECIWTEGNTAVGHDAGATIIDYDSATHYNLLSKALQLIMNQDGTLKDTPIRTALGLSDAANDGWEVFPYTFSVSSGYNTGNNSYNLTVANQDVTSLLSKGMRLRLERSTTAPTQCADFEASSSQYATRASGSVTGITFTDDYTLEAWIKPESLTAGAIVARYDGTSGFLLNMNADCTIRIIGDQGANIDNYSTKVGVSLNKWSHIAVTQDCSGNSTLIYINGISVLTTASTTTATAIVQAGPLQIGAYNSTTFFDGKISDVRIWSAIRTATEIRDNMNQQLTGSETNLVGYWKLDGDFNDSTTNANHLTASGGVVATNLDNPFNDTQYAIVTNVSYSAPNSTVTVYTGNEHIVPNMTLNSPYYSVQKIPYGFPADEGKWIIDVMLLATSSQSTPTVNTWYNLGGSSTIPIGAWLLGYEAPFGGYKVTATAFDAYLTLSTANNTEDNREYTAWLSIEGASGTMSSRITVRKELFVNLDAATTYYINMKTSTGSVNDLSFYGGIAGGKIFAKCAYI